MIGRSMNLGPSATERVPKECPDNLGMNNLLQATNHSVSSPSLLGHAILQK